MTNEKSVEKELEKRVEKSITLDTPIDTAIDVRRARWYNTRYVKGYKLCRIAPAGQLLSVYMGGTEAIEYKIGKWARPRKGCGPLALLKTLDTLEEFLSSWLSSSGPFLCLEVRYEPTGDGQMWYYSGDRLRTRPLVEAVDGTVLAAKVFPVSIVSPATVVGAGAGRHAWGYQRYANSGARPHAFVPWTSPSNGTQAYEAMRAIIGAQEGGW